ncbi:MAG: serine hydrolase [Elusimicrobia bacterium]|nr:serine hydrolase [Elusimicrobiota bacterium]
MKNAPKKRRPRPGSPPLPAREAAQYAFPEPAGPAASVPALPPAPRADQVSPATPACYWRIFWALFPLLGFFLYQDGSRLLKDLDLSGKPVFQKRPVENPVRDKEWESMVAALEKLSGKYKGRAGIYIKDLNTDRVWEHNPDQLFRAASLIKVPIMASVLEKIKRGELSLDTRLKLTRRDRAGGSGSLKWAREGTMLTVMEIVFRMITESDNTATRMLIERTGMDYLQRAFGELGLINTRIYPEGMNLTSGPVSRENYTTAREMAGLLERLYKGEVVDKEASEFMLDMLKHNNRSRSRLRKCLPPGWELGHKTGLLRRACHDMGVVYSPRGDYIIAVLTGDVPDYAGAKNFIARVAKQTYQYYKIDSDFASAGSSSAPGVKPV